MAKDCFDCTFKECIDQGRNSEPYYKTPPKYCMADPIIDRYRKINRPGIAKPCNTCANFNEVSACLRCIYTNIRLANVSGRTGG